MGICSFESCNAFMRTFAGWRIDPNLTHIHKCNSSGCFLRQKTTNACKRKTTEDLFERPSKRMRREISSERLQVLTEGDRAQIRQAIHTASRKVLFLGRNLHTFSFLSDRNMVSHWSQFGCLRLSRNLDTAHAYNDTEEMPERMNSDVGGSNNAQVLPGTLTLKWACMRAK